MLCNIFHCGYRLLMLLGQFFDAADSGPLSGLKALLWSGLGRNGWSRAPVFFAPCRSVSPEDEHTELQAYVVRGVSYGNCNIGEKKNESSSQLRLLFEPAIQVQIHLYRYILIRRARAMVIPSFPDLRFLVCVLYPLEFLCLKFDLIFVLKMLTSLTGWTLPACILPESYSLDRAPRFG